VKLPNKTSFEHKGLAESDMLNFDVLGTGEFFNGCRLLQPKFEKPQKADHTVSQS